MCVKAKMYWILKGKCPCMAPGARFTNAISCFEPGPQKPYRDIFKHPVEYMKKLSFRMSVPTRVITLSGTAKDAQNIW
jgi:hypothetical protein